MNEQRLTRIEAEKAGYIPYAGPYARIKEAHMINSAVRDIINNKRDKHVLVSCAHHQDMIYIIPNFYMKKFLYNEENETEVDKS
jgi:hypothetical protein